MIAERPLDPLEVRRATARSTPRGTFANLRSSSSLRSWRWRDLSLIEATLLSSGVRSRTRWNHLQISLCRSARLLEKSRVPFDQTCSYGFGQTGMPLDHGTCTGAIVPRPVQFCMYSLKLKHLGTIWHNHFPCQFHLSSSSHDVEVWLQRLKEFRTSILHQTKGMTT